MLCGTNKVDAIENITVQKFMIGKGFFFFFFK